MNYPVKNTRIRIFLYFCYFYVPCLLLCTIKNVRLHNSNTRKSHMVALYSHIVQIRIKCFFSPHFVCDNNLLSHICTPVLLSINWNRFPAAAALLFSCSSVCFLWLPLNKCYKSKRAASFHPLCCIMGCIMGWMKVFCPVRCYVISRSRL